MIRMVDGLDSARQVELQCLHILRNLVVHVLASAASRNCQGGDKVFGLAGEHPVFKSFRDDHGIVERAVVDCI